MSDPKLQITTLEELAILREIVDQADADTPHAEVRRRIDAALDEHRNPPPEPPPNRDELLQICRDGFVPQERWGNRDSARAQLQLGSAYALLLAGCDYSLRLDEKLGTWWVRISFHGFSWFEGGYGDEHRDTFLDNDEFYVPTRARLDANAGGDWY